MKRSIIAILCAILALSSSVAVFAAAGEDDVLVGNWETSVYIDGTELITRVGIDKDNEVYIKLREFMEHLGYTVTWNGRKRIVTAENESERIAVYIDTNKCDKNGSMMYVSKAACMSGGNTYMPQSFIQTILGIDTVSVDRAEVSNRVDGVELATNTVTWSEVQESVDNGHQPWRLNPEEVALGFASATLGFKGKAVLMDEAEKEYARVEFTKENGKNIHIGLYQPVKKGKGGIWAVECWFDENSKLYQARDLSKLPPLFHNDDNIPENIKKAVKNAIVAEWTEVFGVYYKVLGFEANNVVFSKDGDKIELKFMLTMVTQNFYKDPDTVAYIKRAKENGLKEYQTLYEEYNLAREANMDLMVAASLSPGGEVIADTIQVFSNVAFSGEEYAPVKAEDFIIKK